MALQRANQWARTRLFARAAILGHNVAQTVAGGYPAITLKRDKDLALQDRSVRLAPEDL
jgi:hypothetical protein